MVTVLISKEADEAMLGMLVHIARNNPSAAVDLIIDLQERAVRTLTTSPNAGVRWRGELRFLIIRGFSFIYRYDASTGEVVIVDVYGPGMNWR